MMEAYLGEKLHYDVCRSYRVSAPAGQIDHPWSHSGWEILIAPGLVPAHVKFHIRGKLYPVVPGQALFLNSREEHTEIYPHDRSSRFNCIVFTKELLNAAFEDTGIDPEEILIHRVAHDIQQDLRSSIQSLLSLRDAKAPGRLAFECLSMELLLLLLERCANSASAKLKRLRNLGHYPSNIARAQKLLAENLSNPDFNLDTLSREAGLSKFHLVRTFKARAGLSPMRYLSEVRLDYAKSLLERQVPVSEAAILSGFQTFSAFNKAFKRTSGLPPSTYRKFWL